MCECIRSEIEMHTIVQAISRRLPGANVVVNTIKRCKNKYTRMSLLNMSNSEYMENLYRAWLKDPKSVDASWDSFFKLVSTDPPSNFNQQIGTRLRKIISTPSMGPSNLQLEKTSEKAYQLQQVRAKSAAELQDDSFERAVLNVNATIRAYQTRGHVIADVDPLGIQNPDSARLQGTANLPPAIVVRQHLKSMTEADMNREFPIDTISVIGGKMKKLPLREILTRLNKIYCGHLGLEYTYIYDINMVNWIRDKFETPNVWELPMEHRKWTWKSVMKAVTFETFMAKKYVTDKRFGLEGCESFITAIHECLESSAEKGVESAVIGMAHRGRLNTLVNVCSKPVHQVCTQFNPISLEGFGSGDVKYHLGTCAEKRLERSGKLIRVSIMANSSHLEAVDPVIVGRVRAEQVAQQDHKSEKSVAVLVHGDAAFSGQGVCYETMHLTHLPNYTTGGVLHFVINNQIGFTTDPRYSRSSQHCTDVARVVNAPIFHVHADDPDLVTYCSKVACEYRAEYHNDVVVDIVGYRRNGHNEMDEPMLTQPLMYKRIKEHPTVLAIYTDKLLKEGVITEEYVKTEKEKYLDHLESEFQKAQTVTSMQMSDWHDVPWNDFFSQQSSKYKMPVTGISMEEIETICTAVSTSPKDITPHAQVMRTLERRRGLKDSRKFDWGMGECIAFLSLLKRGHHVRLSGQDVERGTFSHRMHIIHDQNKDKTYKNILHDVFPGQAEYTVSNSSLSEYGVCGFELGYSAFNHNALTLWEGQFGDFSNGCQVIIDSVLSSGQTKWGRQIGLVMLLPHGMEGQGPEHSSGRLERFLQQSDDDYSYLPGHEPNSPGNETAEEIETRQLFEINWIICNLTTPANLCHALRRQILLPFRKPLVIMTPKSLLRHPLAQSSFDEIGPKTFFKPVLADPTAKPETVKKVLFCSGKVYFELLKERKKQGLDDTIAIVRVEQLCPFPYHAIGAEMAKYLNPKVMWLQEEHKNQGAYSYVRDRLALALDLPLEEIKYGGRPPSAAPSTGSKMIHVAEIEEMMSMAMTLD